MAGSTLEMITEIRGLQGAMEDNSKKGAENRESALKTFASMCESNGRTLEPYLVKLFPQVLALLADKVKPVQEAAKSAVACIPKILNPFACSVTVPILLASMGPSQKPQTRVAAVDLIAHLAENAPAQMASGLVEAIPKLSVELTDLKKEVREAARNATMKCCLSVGNRDVEHLIPQLVSAMQTPPETDTCVTTLAGTVFVSTVTCGALAMIVPLLQRGFALRKDATSRMCAKIVANMAKLVEEPAEAGPFLPLLMPCLEKAADEVSDPEARSVCSNAFETLQRIKAAGDARPYKLANKAEIKDMLQALITKADDTAAAYCSELCGLAANIRCFDEDKWASCIKPYLTDVSSEAEVAAATKAVLDKCEAELAVSAADEDDGDDKAEELCNCEFTLAYGSKILLRNTKMRLLRGYRYGLVGGNESGKTTLMRAIANGQVDGFPPASEVRTVFVEADIIGEKSHMTCTEYVLDDTGIQKLGIERDEVEKMLITVGFSTGTEVKVGAANIGDAVSTLSGGWRMKLALSRAMLQNADILLLDEPTNHLDVLNVKWVQDYLMGLTNVTSIFTSHDSKTLDRVCSHILHISDLKLSLHKGNLTEFVKTHPEAKSYFTLKSEKLKFTFPEPGYLEGVKSKGRALMKMSDCEWTYPCNTTPTVENITIQVSLSSRVAILGPNGAGKSTMIKLLIGENIPQKGTVWKHQGARVAYVAQHAFERIEGHLTKTPNEYIRWRYEIDGEDKEAIKKATMTITEEEEKLRKEGVVLELKGADDKLVKHKGVVEKLTGMRRTNKQREFEYQLKWEGKPDEANIWVPLTKLDFLPKLYGKMVKTVDEKIAAMAGMYIRPLTRENVEKQLEDVGLDKEFGSHCPISQLSGGQKVKVVFAAALWRQPHVVLLDEPTNYLDRESLGALTGAVRDFGGGVVIISHNEEFTSTLCSETWLMSKKEETGIATLTPTGADWMSETLAKALGEAVDMSNKEPEEIIDGAGNVIKLKKRLSEKDVKKRIKEIEKQLKAAKGKGSSFTEEQIWELQDELDELKKPPVAVA